VLSMQVLSRQVLSMQVPLQAGDLPWASAFMPAGG
jgi:hypothetical protein